MTIYRDNSRHAQVCYAPGEKTNKREIKPSDATLAYIKVNLANSPLYKQLFPKTQTEGEIMAAAFNAVSKPIDARPFLPDACCDNPIITMNAGCQSCSNCGWSACHVA
jgi:hypothetical protein